MAGRYSPIWERLKLNGEVTLAIPVPLQKRVIKAVIATKDLDLGHKLLLLESKKSCRISYVINGARVRFNLKTYVQVKRLVMEDL